MQIALLKNHVGPIGGGEKYTLKLAEAFAKQGCSVELITSDRPPLPSYPFTIISAPPLTGSSSQKLLAFDHFCRQYLEKNPKDLVFSLDRTSHQTHLRAGNGVHASYLKRRKPFESRCKSLSFSLNPLHRNLLKIERRAFESPDLKTLFTNSEMVRREILSTYQVNPEKIRVVHNGVEWKEWEAPFSEWQQERASLQEKLSINPSFIFLFIGNNYQRKGLPQLLKGLSHLANEDWILCVLGEDRDSSRYRQMAHSYQIGKKVLFFGPCRDVLPFYQLADCLVIPSIYDPFANVTVEALAMGLFVVSSSSNGGNEVLNQDNGVIIEDLQNSRSISQALKAALDRKKTPEQAQMIRNSTSHLDFDNQLSIITKTSLESTAK